MMGFFGNLAGGLAGGMGKLTGGAGKAMGGAAGAVKRGGIMGGAAGTIGRAFGGKKPIGAGVTRQASMRSFRKGSR